MVRKLISLIGLLTLMVPAHGIAGEISGRASVIDGDTIEIHGQRIRLYGIDAPEAGQTCSKIDGSPWPCGRQAALALSDWLGQRTLRCIAKGRSYDRTVAICKVDDLDLSAWLASHGWAIASVRHSRDYVDEERAARQARRHIWQGAFISPNAWRSRSQP